MFTVLPAYHFHWVFKQTFAFFWNTMKYLLVLCFLAFGAQQAYSQACHMREVDLCVAIGMFHYQSNGIPPDDEKVTEWCETMTEIRECMGNFSAKCLSPVQRELLTLMAGSDEVAKQLCTEGSEVRAKYLTHAECLSEGADSDEFKVELKDLQAVIEKLFDVPFKQRFPLICCGARRFHEKIEANTGRRCGAQSVDMLKSIFKMILTDLPEMVCSQFDPNSAKCREVLPPPGTPSKGADNKSQIGKLLDTVLGNL